MKIKHIHVKNLFGLEKNNFDIECFPNEYITILYGFNGMGKTTLFKIINAACNVDEAELNGLLFESIELNFDNNKTFTIVKKDNDGKFDYTFFSNESPISLDEFKKEMNVIKCTHIFANKDKNRTGKQDSSIYSFTPDDIIYSLKAEINRNITENYEKVNDLVQLLNKDFEMIFKQLAIKDGELKAVPNHPKYLNDPELPITKLSSGEKKLIILFYELLFEAMPDSNKQNSIVLLDEPESSLHLDWQRNLLKTIMKICEEKDIQVLVATHSPAIVEDYFCLQTPMISARYSDE